MGDASIERSPDDGTASFKNVGAAEILPQAQGNRGQYDSRSTAAAKLRLLIAFFVGRITHPRSSP
jgi:hypothetical protein